jgi:hypothetical protein
MATRNDVTGDAIVSRASNQKYSDGWDRIFGKKNKDPYEEAPGKAYDPTSITEDFIFPRDSTGQGTKVETLPGAPEEDEEPLSFIEETDSGFSFEITAEDRAKIHKWLKETVYPYVIAEQKKSPNYPSFSKFMGKNGEEYPYEGAVGGGLTYTFTPTGIGTIIKVKSYDFELDLTDYNNF